MSDSNHSTHGGIGIAGALGITFVILKLTGVINWSWWWVLAPWWICFVLATLILIGAVIATLLLHARNKS